MAWPFDEGPDTLHIGGYRAERMVGIATVHRQPMPGSAEPQAWRVRGIAVEHGHRGYGLGGMLLQRCLDHAAVNRAGVVWAHARVGAFGFFRRYGFQRRGEPFELPDIGPLYVVFLEMAA